MLGAGAGRQSRKTERLPGFAARPRTFSGGRSACVRVPAPAPAPPPSVAAPAGTRTLDWAELVFPEASAAVNVSAVVRGGKRSGASFVTPGAGSTRSVACTPARSAAIVGCVLGAPPGSVASTTTSGGAFRTGAVVSRTTTTKVASAALPLPSEAVHVTVDVPSGKVAPGAGAQVTGTGPSRSSVARSEEHTS